MGDQSLDELACSLEYDEEDRRGESAPSNLAANDKNSTKKGSRGKAGGRKRPQPAKGVEASDGEGDEAPEQSKKKPRHSSGSGGPSSAQERTLRPGVVDWQAVADEFGV